MHELTLVLNLHREGHYAVVAAKSAAEAVAYARRDGHDVALGCVLDRPDHVTRAAAAGAGVAWDFMEEVDHGDLGLSRNEALKFVSGEYVGFMDGDDLCGHEWLSRALSMARTVAVPSVLHPHFVYYFNETDFLSQSQSITPSPSARSFWFEHIASTDPGFSVDLLRFNNVYTSNAIAPREVYARYPYIGVDRENGFGVEDWTWNALTLGDGIPHLVVPDTVHMVRVKQSGSLGQDNARQGLLPHLTEAFRGKGTDGRRAAR